MTLSRNELGLDTLTTLRLSRVDLVRNHPLPDGNIAEEDLAGWVSDRLVPE